MPLELGFYFLGDFVDSFCESSLSPIFTFDLISEFET